MPYYSMKEYKLINFEKYSKTNLMVIWLKYHSVIRHMNSSRIQQVWVYIRIRTMVIWNVGNYTGNAIKKTSRKVIIHLVLWVFIFSGDYIMEVLIKATLQNVSYVCINDFNDRLFYIKQFCSFNNIIYLDDGNDYKNRSEVFCKKQDYWYVVYEGNLINNEYETKALYQLIFISKDTLSPFHKEL